jgi:hypothetical protein
MRTDYFKLASEETIKKTCDSLNANGIATYVCKDAEETEKKLLELLPEKAEVMIMSSTTLNTLGLTDRINDSDKYISVKKKLSSMDMKTQGSEMRKLGAGPDFALGSVHAITENGELLIASMTGSQLSAHSYAAGKVIFVAGTQKIVKDLQEGMQRIYEYTLPLESERAQKVYGVSSSVNKLLTIFKEFPGRISVIFIKQNVGF